MPKIAPKIGRPGVRKRRKSIPTAYHAPKNRGVRTPNSKSLTEALHQRLLSCSLSVEYSPQHRSLDRSSAASPWVVAVRPTVVNTSLTTTAATTTVVVVVVGHVGAACVVGASC